MFRYFLEMSVSENLSKRLRSQNRNKENDIFSSSSKVQRSPPSSQLSDVFTEYSANEDSNVRSKRKRENSTPTADMSNVSLSQLRVARDNMYAIVNRDDKISKYVSNSIREVIQKYEDLLNDCFLKNKDLEVKIASLASVHTATQKPVEVTNCSAGGASPSYASAARSKPVSSRYRVIVEPSKDGNSVIEGEPRLTLVNEILKGSDLKIHGMSSSRGSGLIVNMASGQDMERLLTSIEKKSIGLSAKKVEPLGHSFLVFGIESDYQDSELLNAIYRKNFINKNITLEDFNKFVSIKRRKRTGNVNFVNVILVVRNSKSILSVFKNYSRIFSDTGSHGIIEIDDVLRCYKCHGFDHTSKFCKSKVQLCSDCGGEHSARDCSEKIKNCINCKKGGQESNHSVFSKDCPYYLTAVAKYRSRILSDNDGT